MLTIMHNGIMHLFANCMVEPIHPYIEAKFPSRALHIGPYGLEFCALTVRILNIYWLISLPIKETLAFSNTS